MVRLDDEALGARITVRVHGASSEARVRAAVGVDCVLSFVTGVAFSFFFNARQWDQEVKRARLRGSLNG